MDRRPNGLGGTRGHEAHVTRGPAKTREQGGASPENEEGQKVGCPCLDKPNNIKSSSTNNRTIKRSREMLF